MSSLGASYCTRIFVSRASAFARLHAAANAPESAVERKRAAPACGRKRLLRPSRESPASTRPPRSRSPCPRSAHRITRESSSPARRLSPGCAPPPMRPNPPSEGSAPRQHAGENDFYDPPRAFTVISRVHSTATVARTVPLLGASRESSSPAHRLSRGYAKCQRAGKNDFYDPHGNLPHPLDRHGRAHRVLARRIILHANLRLPRVGLRAATRCRQCARIRRRKEARRASVRAKTTSTTRPAPSR